MVSELGLGGYQFTGEFGVSRSDALEAIEAAFRSGITFVDTAPMYGSGESEELIGRVLARHPEVHVSGKVGYLDRTIVRHLGSDAYKDPYAIQRVVAHSLHLLGRDHLDVALIHEPEWSEWGLDRSTGDAPVTSALEQLRMDGVVGAIGLGGQDADLMADLLDSGRFDVVLSVMHYDLAVQDARHRLLPAAERHDVGVILGTPLRQGLLARPHDDPRTAMVADADRPVVEQVALANRLRAIYDLATQTRMPVPEMALRFLLSDRRISAVIPGVRSVQDVRLNLESAARGPLPSDLVVQIERLS
jgi:aryl-alcohol dehydrogenase-like predicted oxidoreductase